MIFQKHAEMFSSLSHQIHTKVLQISHFKERLFLSLHFSLCFSSPGTLGELWKHQTFFGLD